LKVQPEISYRNNSISYRLIFISYRVISISYRLIFITQGDNFITRRDRKANRYLHFPQTPCPSGLAGESKEKVLALQEKKRETFS
jgi:hypothetical protein